nr:1492_t:CDS:2 [Entrophospora candida]
MHVVISELRIHKWTEDYKSKTLNDFRENNTIRNISRNNCTNEMVDLEIELTVEQMEKTEKEGLKDIPINNCSGNIQYDVFAETNQYNGEFIYMKLDPMLKFEGLKKAEIVKLLESHKFEKIYDVQSEENSSEGTDTNRNTKGYEYLMKLTCLGFSREEVDKYENKEKSLYSELKIISEMSIQYLWLKDLEAAWDEFVNANQENISTSTNTTKTTKTTKNLADNRKSKSKQTKEKIENIMDDVDSSDKDYTEQKTTIKKANKGKSKLKAKDDEFKLNHTTATSSKSKVIETVDDDDTDYIELHETKTTTNKANKGRSKLKVEDDEFKLNNITATSSKRKIIEMVDDDDYDYIEPHETEIMTKKRNLRTVKKVNYLVDLVDDEE